MHYILYILYIIPTAMLPYYTCRSRVYYNREGGFGFGFALVVDNNRKLINNTTS